MKHFASPSFWRCYRALSASTQQLADDKFALLKQDSSHPSLHFKKIDTVWSCRIGLHYRALGAQSDGDVVWFWIGTHAEYDKLIG